MSYPHTPAAGRSVGYIQSMKSDKRRVLEMQCLFAAQKIHWLPGSMRMNRKGRACKQLRPALRLALVEQPSLECSSDRPSCDGAETQWFSVVNPCRMLLLYNFTQLKRSLSHDITLLIMKMLFDVHSNRFVFKTLLWNDRTMLSVVKYLNSCSGKRKSGERPRK